MNLFQEKDDDKRPEKIEILKNTFKVSIDMNFSEFKMFVMAFWGLSHKVFDLYELTNSNMVILTDHVPQDDNPLRMSIRKSKAHSEYRSTVHPGTRHMLRKSHLSELDSIRLSNGDMNRDSFAKPKLSKYNPRSDKNLEDTSMIDSDWGAQGKFNQTKRGKKNSLFNDQIFMNKKNQIGNLEKDKSKKNFQNLYEFPFASVSEVNLIRKSDIDFYKDLLSIDKKGSFNERKNAF
jgi:hypothetical protein